MYDGLPRFTAYDISKDVLLIVACHHSAHLRRLFRQTNFNTSDPLAAQRPRYVFSSEEL